MIYMELIGELGAIPHAPQNDNILNTLDGMISALRDPTASTEQINALAASTQTHISNTQTRVNSTLGNIV